MTIVFDKLVSILTDFKTFFYALSLRFLPSKNVLLSLNNTSSSGGDFRMKVTEKLVVSLSCRFWSHDKAFRTKANILLIQVSLRVNYERKLKIYDKRMTMLLKSNNRIQHSM